MIVQLYKPNPRNTGYAFSFDIGSANQSQEPCVYVRAVRQHSWNDKELDLSLKTRRIPKTLFLSRLMRSKWAV